jgi:hypothetical protein
MSRAMNLTLALDEVVKRCEAQSVSISAIEALPSGNTHLVCTTGEGAETMRKVFNKHVIEGRQKRYPFVTVRASRT